MFGLPIARVQDVFKPMHMTRVPLAGAEIAGVLNLRGRIVTAIDMRKRLDVKRRESGAAPMAIGIEANGESFGLLVDAVGEVLKLANAQREPNPINLDVTLAALSAGVYRLDGQLLVVLDIDQVLDLRSVTAAA
jgi:purine-binding chemotaxis protein CheW